MPDLPRNFSVPLEERVSAILNGPPAYVRRAKAVELLQEQVLADLAARRDRALAPVRRARGRAVAREAARFEQRWSRVLDAYDLGPLNQAIEDYNRYYLLEREAFARFTGPRSWHWKPLPPWTRADLEARFPPVAEL